MTVCSLVENGRSSSSLLSRTDGRRPLGLDPDPETESLSARSTIAVAFDSCAELAEVFDDLAEY